MCSWIFLIVLIQIVVGDPLKARELTKDEKIAFENRISALHDPVGPSTPQQIHINYGDDTSSTMVVTWSTREEVCSEIHVGDRVFSGNSSFWNNTAQYIHIVEVDGLEERVNYTYSVGCAAEKGGLVDSWFFSGGSPTKWVPTFAVYGDFGMVNDRSLGDLISDAESGKIDVALHFGDLAYDLDSDGGKVGDAFMNAIQGFASNIPVHFCPGNHESDEGDLFGNYRARIGHSMPAPEGSEGLFHKIEVGLATIVLFSSEVYFYDSKYGLGMVEEQFLWLNATLASVNRTKTPWLITGAHRPQYCSPNDDADSCHSQYLNPMRTGILGEFAIEPLLQKYGVDVHFSAHEHAYERSFPIYNYNVTSHSYVNPTAPVHILSGAAGCPENQDPWQPDQAPYVAFLANVYGYGRLSFPSASEMHWEFWDVDHKNITDSLTITQQKHGPFPSN